MAQSKSQQKPTLTPPKVITPSINRQQSYPNHASSIRTWSSPVTNARTFLSQVASRTTPPRRLASSYTSSTESSPTFQTESPPMERRRSWEDCVHQRDGYISFPDFDQLKEDARDRQG